MKRTLIYSFVLPALLAGCKKQQNEPVDSISLIGTWELRAEYGGIVGRTQTFAPGNNILVQFNADSTFKFSQPSATVNQGTFSILKNATTIGQTNFDEIFYNHGTVGTVIMLKSDTLTLGIDYDDEIASVYVRQ